MRRVLVKLGPTAAVALLAGYCCLPDTLPAAADAGGKTKPPELTTVLLAPPTAPAPTRDPFNLKAVASKKAPPARPAQPDGGPGKSASTARAQAPKSRPAATGLTLSATLLRGQRRVAMINGKFFAEGEPLKGVSAGPLTLARVFPDHVLLRQGEETLDLKFPEKSETRSPSPGAAKPAGPKRPAQTPPRTRTR